MLLAIVAESKPLVDDCAGACTYCFLANPLASAVYLPCFRMEQAHLPRCRCLARKLAVPAVKMQRLRRLMQQPALRSLGRRLSLQQPALHQQRLRPPASTSLQHLQQRGTCQVPLQTPPA